MFRIPNKSSQPAARWGHSTAFVGDELYLWGGLQKDAPTECTSGKKERYFSNVSVLQLRTGLWKNHITHWKPHLGITNYSCAVIGKKIVFFGGWCGHDSCYYNTVTCLNTENLDWEEMPHAHADKSVKPVKKQNSGMMSFKYKDEELLYVVGGYGEIPSENSSHFQFIPSSKNPGSGHTNEQHILSLKSGMWMIPTITGKPPPPCSAFSFTSVDMNKGVMVAGYVPDGQHVNDVNLVELSKRSVHWSKIHNKDNIWLDGRCLHSTCCISNGQQLFTLGGMDKDDNTLSQGVILDLEKNVSEQMIFPESVTKRLGFSMSSFSFHPCCVWVVIFGGLKNWLGGKKTLKKLPMLADTTLIELVFSDGKWRMSEVSSSSVLGSQDYERRLLNNMTECNIRMQQEIRIITETAAEYEQKVHQLSSKLDLATSNMTEAQQIRQVMETKLDKFQSQVIKLEQDKSASDQQLAEEHIQLEAAELELSQLRGQVQDLTRVITILEQNWAIERNEIVITDEIIGSGAWGEVRIAMFRGLRVVAKTLHGQIISEFNLQTFQREMAIASIIRHPNLLQFIGAVTDGTPIILTELMTTNLRAQLERARMSDRNILSIAEDVALALNYLHLFRPNPIIHRDLSSANVLLYPIQDVWRAKVSDFGTANFKNHIRLISAGPGNPVYSAPEARFPDEHSPKMDVFSFGVLAIELVLHQPPGMTTADKERQVSEIKWPEMVSLIRSCLLQLPTNRPNMISILSSLRNTSPS